MPVGRAVIVSDLVKIYTYHHKQPGFLGSLSSLVRRQTIENRAVDGISFSIDCGEIVGFLGPNGAGKTTTLKMLSGLLYPSSGTVSVLGHIPYRRETAFLRRISLVMGQKSMLFWDIPAMETLLLHKVMYRISDAQFRATVHELAEMLDVGHLLDVQVRRLSLGERMKMELIAALAHQPEVLFLDEPTIGLDVVSQQRVRAFLRELNQRHGTTILLTSHYMDDIEALCPRVIVIDNGRIGYDGALLSLSQKVAPVKLLTATFMEPVSEEKLTAAIGGAQIMPGNDPATVRLRVPRELAPQAAAQLLGLGNVTDLDIEQTPLEEIIREVFGAATLERREV